ncbi:aminotransferase class IV [Subtercola sp. YIM 133946]|uniref:aminotransferase class IV n=1 Tax=Subtercola sp. YIM 133946 TaxID=3118909 RepID=UPI002F9218F1
MSDVSAGQSSPDEAERRFVFRDGELRLQQGAPDARRRLLVADSWLVDHGRVRAIDLHRDRFVGSCLASGYSDRATLDAFWASALGALPPVHRWFPRVELWATPGGGPSAVSRPGRAASGDGTAGHGTAGDGTAGHGTAGHGTAGHGTAGDGTAGDGTAGGFELSVLVRLAPAPAGTAVLGTHLGEEPRSIPSVKGPDLERLTTLRNAARERGIDDLVILAGDAAIVDGTTTALLWWRGDELHVPPAALARVDSVTARTIRVLAQALGVPVVEERAAPTDLRGCEVWAVNALYGIRSVTEWAGGPAVAADEARAAQWQRRLGQLARPLA